MLMQTLALLLLPVSPLVIDKLVSTFRPMPSNCGDKRTHRHVRARTQHTLTNTQPRPRQKQLTCRTGIGRTRSFTFRDNFAHRLAQPRGRQCLCGVAGRALTTLLYCQQRWRRACAARFRTCEGRRRDHFFRNSLGRREFCVGSPLEDYKRSPVVFRPSSCGGTRSASLKVASGQCATLTDALLLVLGGVGLRSSIRMSVGTHST